MLSDQDNELLTRVEPGMAMGNLMRQYWLPALLSSELPSSGCRPVRVLILGERLVAYRSVDGKVGLLRDGCPHRGTSLALGRVEGGGLRCAYHGWKFGLDGCLLEAPNEEHHHLAALQSVAAAHAYPTTERGGIVWAYLGLRSTPPSLPALEPNLLPDREGRVTALIRNCNWLQALEGDLDASHLAFLHFGGRSPATTEDGSFIRLAIEDRAPKYEVVDTDAGSMYTAFRPAGHGWTYHRIAYSLFPCYTLIETNVLGLQARVRAWVPMDDEHVMFFGMYSDRQEPPAPGHTRTGYEMLPNGTGWLERFRSVANAGNDYLIDRERQCAGDYTGILGISTQDACVNESMGPIARRNAENLGAADAMIIRVRQRLLAATRALRDHGTAPPGVDIPDSYAVRSGGIFLPAGTSWVEATRGLRTPMAVPHGKLTRN